ncbi:MAG: hypothetical protein NC043_01910 [Muribaculaceae bacterium]|nr:hypothetical protein [Muribaculaceae bacterium]
MNLIKYLSRFLFFIVIIMMIGVPLTSCGGDEPDNPEYPDKNDSTDEDDEYKYQIVGIWEAKYTWKYSGIIETIVLEFFRNETYSFVSTSTNDPKPFPGTGKWSYDKKTHKWHLGGTSSSMIPGDYVLVNGQLILSVQFEDGSSRTVIYNRRNSSGNSDDNEGSSQSQSQTILIKHKTWSWYKNSYDNGFFTFYDTNKIQFVNSGKSKMGSYGVPTLDARGTFTISGNTLSATYNSVSADPSLTSSEMSKHFPGWSIGKTKAVKYTIKSLDNNGLTLTDGSTTWSLEPIL